MLFTYLHPMIFRGCLFHSLDEVKGVEFRLEIFRRFDICLPDRGTSPHKNLSADKVLLQSLLLHCFLSPGFTQITLAMVPPERTPSLLLVHTCWTKSTDSSACVVMCNPAGK